MLNNLSNAGFTKLSCGLENRVTRQQTSTQLESSFRSINMQLLDWLERKLGDRQSAEDVAQAAYLATWKRAGSCEIENPNALIFKIARDLTNNEYKRRSRNSARFVNGNLDEKAIVNTADPSISPEISLVEKQELQSLLSDIELLPPKLRLAFKLNRFSEKNYSDIAIIMGVSVSSVEKYIMKALLELRKSGSAKLKVSKSSK